MITKGIRGAITVDDNTSIELKQATIELIDALARKNKIQKDLISHIIFTLTEDLNADFPAKFAREHFGWNDVAMLCFNELNVPNSITMCLRVLIVINCEENFKPKHVYLKSAKVLRPDFD